VRIRIYRAFASNNSGSYTLVGRFDDDATAGEVAAVLAEMCAAHSAWFKAHSSDPIDGSPLLAFARANNLVNTPDHRDDQWPEYGPPPQVIHTGPQVLVLAPYTVTMPATLGEYIYRRGGRVELEIDHGHGPLGVEFTFSVSGARLDDRATSDRIDALRVSIDAELPALTARAEWDRRPIIAPCWHTGDWHQRQLSVVFTDPGTGVLRVRELARAAGVAAHVRIFELSDRDPDPFSPLRGTGRRERGRHRVALWSVPAAARIAVMKVVRELVGCPLDIARKLVDEVPCELLEHVAEPVAEDAARQLRDAGADADAFVPRQDT
jgi:ribosomal protein L7/L12